MSAVTCPDRLAIVAPQGLARMACLLALLLAAALQSACTTAVVLMHVHEKLTEGDPKSCWQLRGVERALQVRCGEFVAGSLTEKDVGSPGLPVCPLTLATRDPRLWPVLPELLERGAAPERCAESPWVALAQAPAPVTPEFATASPAVLQALRFLAVADARAIHHDVLRLLSGPSAQAAGLSSVVETWRAQGQLLPGALGFSPLGALHPTQITGPLAAALEADAHSARRALGAYVGQLPSGFELALQDGDLAALDWWLTRVPELAQRVPPSHANQLAWLPLARVLTPSFMPDAERQHAVVIFLLAHGADPWARLPHEPSKTVLALAQRLHSPATALLAAAAMPVPAPVQAPEGTTTAGVTLPAVPLAHVTEALVAQHASRR